jgi:iron complex transport system ATP-binding protein
VDELSGGEQKRVAIARALAQAAEVLLLDEPTANLDINYQVSVMALLLTLVRRKGTTVVTVLHDLNLAASYCDAVVLMDKGRVHAAGKPRDVITRENVRAVYGPGFEVTMSATTGRPFVLPSAVRSQAEKRFLAFVIGGGGSAAPLLNNLVRERVNVSLGVINAGDADWFTCQALGVPVIEEEPFSPVRKESLDRAMVCALEADAVVIAPTPFGPGNVSSLGVAEKALAAEKTVVIVAPRTIGQRDYTGGEAERRVSALIADGALTALDEDEALNILRRCGKWDERY